MQKIDTANGKFDELSQEIYVSNKWLNDVQNEIINVIEKEGIVLDGSKNDQLNEAINKKIAKLSVRGNNNSSDFIVSKDIPSIIRGVKSDDTTKTISSREKPNGKWLSCSREFNYNDSPELNMFFNMSFDALKDGSIPSKKHIALKYDSLFTRVEELENQIKTMLASNTELANAERDRKTREQAALDKLKKDQDELAAKQLKLEEDARKAEAARKEAEEKKKQEDAIKAAVETALQAERDRLASEQAERDRLAREQAERDRLAREQAERDRLAREQAERDRLAREQAEIDHEQAERNANNARNVQRLVNQAMVEAIAKGIGR